MIILAPMAGVTDIHFRSLAFEMGCDLAYTEMVSAKGLIYKNKNTNDLLKLNPCEKTGVQLFGSDPSVLSEVALMLEDMGFLSVDINMGCPMPKIVKNGEGCALMNDIGLVERIIKAVSSKIKKPVTAKIRKGIDGNDNALDVAKAIEAGGGAGVCVHGRTREQYYSGEADWDIIKSVKQSISIPVTGNGDIFTPEDAKRMLEYTGCDSIMIARGAKGNPWIFKAVKDYLKTGVYTTPSIEDRIAVANRHCLMQRDSGKPLVEMRKHYAWYIKGAENAAYSRSLLNTAATYEDFISAGEKILRR